MNETKYKQLFSCVYKAMESEDSMASGDSEIHAFLRS